MLILEGSFQVKRYASKSVEPFVFAIVTWLSCDLNILLDTPCSIHCIEYPAVWYALDTRDFGTGIRINQFLYGIWQTLRLSRAKTTAPINTKFWKKAYVGQIKRLAKFHRDRFNGCGFPCGGNIQFQILVFLLILLFCFFLFRQLTCRPKFATDFDIWWLKRCGLI